MVGGAYLHSSEQQPKQDLNGFQLHDGSRTSVCPGGQSPLSIGPMHDLSQVEAPFRDIIPATLCDAGIFQCDRHLKREVKSKQKNPRPTYGNRSHCCKLKDTCCSATHCNIEHYPHCKKTRHYCPTAKLLRGQSNWPQQRGPLRPERDRP